MAGVTDQYRLPFTSHLTPAGRWRKLSETLKPIIQTDHEPARTARLVRGARAARVVTRPTTATSAPHTTASSHGAWVAAASAAAWPSPAATRERTPLVSMAPITATPKTLPNWRVAEMTADATPACDGGMPLAPGFVIGGGTPAQPLP